MFPARHKIRPYLYSLPACFSIAFFLVGPVLLVILMSFTDYQLGESGFSFVGFENYREIFQDPTFAKAVKNTFVYTLMTVPVTLFGGLFIASQILKCSRLQSLYQTMFFLPYMSTLIAMLLVWDFVLNPTIGLWADILRVLGMQPFNLLQREATALPTLALLSIWHYLGFATVLYTAALSGISQEIYDAAKLDCIQSGITRFMKITWPLISHVTFFIFIMLMVYSFRVFESVAILTEGGPNEATEVITYVIYKEGFEFFRTNIASAMTVVFLLALGVLLIIKSYFLEKKIHY